MDRALVWISSKHVGQGKTTVVHRVVDEWVTTHGMRVGGFSLRRVWGADAAGRSRHVGYEAHLWRTGETIEVARVDRPEWIRVNAFGLRQFAQDKEASFFVNPDSIDILMRSCSDELEESDLDAFVLDEVGVMVLAGMGRDLNSGIYPLAMDALLSKINTLVIVFQDSKMRGKEAMQLMTNIKHDFIGHGRDVRKHTISTDNLFNLHRIILEDTH